MPYEVIRTDTIIVAILVLLMRRETQINELSKANLVQRTDSFEKTLMLGKIEGWRRRGQQRMRWLDGFINSMDVFEQAPGVGDGQGGLACCNSWGRKELDTTERLN